MMEKALGKVRYERLLKGANASTSSTQRNWRQTDNLSGTSRSLVHHSKYGLGRPFGCIPSRTTGPQTTPHVAEVRDHGLSRLAFWNKPAKLSANPLRSEFALNQFRNDVMFMFCDQVHHRETIYLY